MQLSRHTIPCQAALRACALCALGALCPPLLAAAAPPAPPERPGHAQPGPDLNDQPGTDPGPELNKKRSEDAGAPAWELSGFGTLGVVHADTRQADFVLSNLKARGAGASRSTSAAVDSRLGAQLDLTLGAGWSGVLQVISEQRSDGSFRPHVEWANLKYQLTPDLSLRAGRIALPIFMAADYRKVGYAMPMLRTAVEVYSSVPVSNNDGVDLSYRWRAGAVKSVTQVFYGHTSFRLADASSIKGRGLAGLSNSFNVGDVSGRFGVFTGKLDIGLGDALFDGLRQFGPAGQALAAQHEIHDKRVNLATLGATYDPGAWFVAGEVSRFNTHGFIGNSATRAVNGGYRLDAFTPYLGYASVRALRPTSDPGLPTAGLPPPLAAAAGALNAGLNQLLRIAPDQSTLSAGLRWDLVANAALKVQYDRVRPRKGSPGSFLAVQPGFRSGQTVNVTSAALDFVF